MPEIGPPGSESGGRKRAHGNRSAAPAAKAPDEPPTPYRLRASPRLYTNLVGTLHGASVTVSESMFAVFLERRTGRGRD